MHCTLTSLQSAAGDEAVENVFTSGERRLFAVTGGEGAVRVFRAAGEGSEPELLKELKHHQAPVMAIAFAPLTHRNYLLSAAYDRSLSLHDLDDSKTAEPLFAYHEENKDIGFFTACCFALSARDQLTFLAGTSTGDLLIFDSASGFEARRLQAPPARGSVKSISCGRNGRTLVAFSGSETCLFFDASFSLSVEFGADLHSSNKTTLALFAPLRAPGARELILTAGEDLKVGLWTIEAETHAVLLLKSFSLELPLVTAFWNFSGLSFQLVLSRKGEKADGVAGVEFLRGAFKLEGGDDEWSLEPVSVDKSS